MARFYFDEDSAQHRPVAALRSHTIDVTTFLDSGMRARDDESQLIVASEQERILVSGNARDFARLHQDWLAQGRAHSGILNIPQQRYSTGEVLRRMIRITSCGFELAGGLYYLSNF